MATNWHIYDKHFRFEINWRGKNSFFSGSQTSFFLGWVKQTFKIFLRQAIKTNKWQNLGNHPPWTWENSKLGNNMKKIPPRICRIGKKGKMSPPPNYQTLLNEFVISQIKKQHSYKETNVISYKCLLCLIHKNWKNSTASPFLHFPTSTWEMYCFSYTAD